MLYLLRVSLHGLSYPHSRVLCTFLYCTHLSLASWLLSNFRFYHNSFFSLLQPLAFSFGEVLPVWLFSSECLISCLFLSDCLWQSCGELLRPSIIPHFVAVRLLRGGFDVIYSYTFVILIGSFLVCLALGEFLLSSADLCLVPEVDPSFQSRPPPC